MMRLLIALLIGKIAAAAIWWNPNDSPAAIMISLMILGIVTASTPQKCH